MIFVSALSVVLAYLTLLRTPDDLLLSFFEASLVIDSAFLIALAFIAFETLPGLNKEQKKTFV